MTCRETLFSMLLCFLFAPSPDYPGHSDHKEMTFRLGHCVVLGLVVQMVSSLSLRQFFRSMDYGTRTMEKILLVFIIGKMTPESFY